MEFNKLITPTTSLMGNHLKNNSDLRKTLGLWTKFHTDHYSDLCLLRC